MWKAIKAMFSSRKFLAAILSGIVWATGKFGAHLDADELIIVVAPLWGYIFGTSIEDVAAKTAAGRVAAAAAAPSTAPIVTATSSSSPTPEPPAYSATSAR